MTEADCIRNINSGFKLRSMIREGSALLQRNDTVGSQFTITIYDPVTINFKGKHPEVRMLDAIYDLDINQTFTKCSCMPKILKGNIRDQNNWW